jgi:hypothetical protein
MQIQIRKCALYIALLLMGGIAHGQTYQNVLPNWGIYIDFVTGEYGGGASLVDWDGDGWDDLSVCQNGTNPRFFKNYAGVFQEIEPFFENEGELKQMCWVDFDNDGDKDLSVTTHLAPTRIFRNEGGVLVDFTDDSGIVPTNYLTFGHSWGDYDNDGLLDLYICHYHYFESIPNQCYHNNGDGTFTDVASSIGVSDFANFSFQGVWLDYNEDGWQDLFVINDRLYSSNHLYRNDGGIFTDVTLDANLEQYIFSMSNTVGDYDNDGDFDIFVSNNPSGHLLHQQQDDGTFLEVADAAGVATYDMGWSAQWIDYNLDGWQDLHVNCSPFWSEQGQNKFYVNNQDGTFTYNVSMGFANDLAWSQSSAVGDVNHDGVFDIMVVNDAPDKCSLWLSSAPINNYLKVGLKGVVGNMDGIGSKIICYANDLEQMRYTYCGEGYLCQNSTTEIFGLGQAEVVDSLQITWLSGHVDMFYNIDVNQKIVFVEGSSLSIDLASNNSPFFCEGDSVLVTAADGYASYLWSNGDVTQSTYSSQAENLTVTAITDLGIQVVSTTFQTSMVYALDVSWSQQNVSCFGLSDGEISVDMSSFENVDILWLDGSQEPVLDSLYAGQYSAELIDSMGCATSILIEVVQPEPLQINTDSSDVSCFGWSDGSISVDPTGGQGTLVLDWDGADPAQLSAGEFLITLTDSVGCMLQELVTILQPEELVATLEVVDFTEVEAGSASIAVQGGLEPYEILWSNQDEGPNASNLDEGEYSVVVTDANGCALSIDFVVNYVSVSELNSISFNVFPNPASNSPIQITSKYPMAELRIYSSLGALVSQEQLNKSLACAVLSPLESGNYIYEVLFANGRVARTNVTIVAD